MIWQVVESGCYYRRGPWVILRMSYGPKSRLRPRWYLSKEHQKVGVFPSLEDAQRHAEEYDNGKMVK